MKSKKQRANNKSYVTETLRKAIMKRSELPSKYHETKNAKDYSNYDKQRNFCSKLCKEERRKFYKKLDIEDITDNKKFWKTLKPLLSDKGACGASKKIYLITKKFLKLLTIILIMY